MKLVIAEKPSVAMSLAAVLGATERKDGYLEGSGYLVSWCVGHLLELAQPEAYKEQYAKWRYEDLPILPENWKYEVPKDKKKQLALLCRLMKDKRVDSVVCATDAGREGELIFRLVYEYAGCNKPMERLWISSMEDAAIREGFDHLRPGSDYDKLYDVAVGVCPRCGAPVYEGKKGFFCDNRECSFALWKDNRFFSSKKKSITKSVAAALLKEGRISMSGLYSEKTGKTYDAEVILDDTGGKYVNFKLEFPVKKGRRK